MKINPVPLSKSDLMSVESPARYVGGEFNAVIKEDMLEELEKTGKTSYVRFAFCFPDMLVQPFHTLIKRLHRHRQFRFIGNGDVFALYLGRFYR